MFVTQRQNYNTGILPDEVWPLDTWRWRHRLPSEHRNQRPSDALSHPIEINSLTTLVCSFEDILWDMHIWNLCNYVRHLHWTCYQLFRVTFINAIAIIVGLVLQRFVLWQFTFMTLVEFDWAFQLVVHRCSNSSDLSLPSVFLALFLCVCVSYFLFPPMTVA
jgi:hypothetical protein